MAKKKQLPKPVLSVKGDLLLAELLKQVRAAEAKKSGNVEFRGPQIFPLISELQEVGLVPSSRSKVKKTARNTKQDLKDGIWVTREGKRLKIIDMSDEHLKNAIAFMEKNPKWRAKYLPILRQEMASRVIGKHAPEMMREDMLLLEEQEERDRFTPRDI